MEKYSTVLNVLNVIGKEKYGVLTTMSKYSKIRKRRRRMKEYREKQRKINRKRPYVLRIYCATCGSPEFVIANNKAKYKCQVCGEILMNEGKIGRANVGDVVTYYE